MRLLMTFLVITILAVLLISGCHLILPFESRSVSPTFEGTFRGPIQSDYPTGSAMWGDTLEIELKLDKLKTPPSQAKDHSPVISGTGTSYYANGQFKWKFHISGYITKESDSVAKLTLEEFQSHKKTKATATMQSDNKTLDLIIDWPSGLKAKAKLTKK